MYWDSGTSVLRTAVAQLYIGFDPFTILIICMCLFRPGPYGSLLDGIMPLCAADTPSQGSLDMMHRLEVTTCVSVIKALRSRVLRTDHRLYTPSEKMRNMVHCSKMMRRQFPLTLLSYRVPLLLPTYHRCGRSALRSTLGSTYVVVLLSISPLPKW